MIVKRIEQKQYRFLLACSFAKPIRTMCHTGLLVLTSPVHVLSRIIPGLLSQCEKFVDRCLYVQLNSIGSQVTYNTVFPRRIPYTLDIGHFMAELYRASVSSSSCLNCYMLVGNIGNVAYTHHHVAFDVLLLEQQTHPQEGFATNLAEKTAKFHGLPKTPSLQVLKPVEFNGPSRNNYSQESWESVEQSYKKGIMGGTFDRLHVGHKIMLTEACLRCDDTIVVGVSDTPNIINKVLPELIEPLETRMANITSVLQIIKPNIATDVLPLVGLFGPSTVYPDLDCIIVSKETEGGGKLVNVERAKKGLNQLDMVCIDLVCETGTEVAADSCKISSSVTRCSLLGDLYHPLTSKPIPLRPYRIGLTGGIASGKSSVSARLQRLGAGIIDCDKLGHSAYLPGSDCYNEVVSHFGADILGKNGEIDRAKLGALVFSDKKHLDELNVIVWPWILRLAEEKLHKFEKEGVRVVVYDAAVLLEAGWDHGVHEVWVCVIPENEAVTRIQQRNKLSDEAARQRIGSQMSSEARVDRANVVLCTLWERSVTQKQVEKAWNLLQERLPDS